MAFKKKTATLLAEHRQRLADKLTERDRRVEARTAKLLADADAGRAPDVAQIEADIAVLEVDVGHLRETIAALEKRAAEEKVADQVKQRAGLVAREEAGFQEHIEHMAEGEKLIEGLHKWYRDDIKIRNNLLAGYPWDNSQKVALALYGLGAKEDVAHQFYKTSFQGGMESGPNFVSLPGSICPRPLEWRNLPDKISSLTARARERAAYASKIMRSGKAGPARLAASPELSVANDRKVAILNQMAEAAKDVSPEGARKYEALVAQLTALSFEQFTAAPETRPAAMEKSA